MYVSAYIRVCIIGGEAYLEWPESLLTGETSLGSTSLGVYRLKPFGTVQMKTFMDIKRQLVWMSWNAYLPIV
jgi:hypothetical protein